MSKKPEFGGNLAKVAEKKGGLKKKKSSKKFMPFAKGKPSDKGAY